MANGGALTASHSLLLLPRSLIVLLQFTSKLEGMVTDMNLSSDLQIAFSEHLSSKEIDLKTDLSVQVLTTGFWPTYKSDDLSLPSEMLQCIEAFKVWRTRKELQEADRCSTADRFPSALSPISSFLRLQTFYDGRTSHRRLRWVHSLGSATVLGSFVRARHSILARPF